MSAFVLLALALAFVALGAAAVAGRQLYLAVRRLRAMTERTSALLTPLLDDLQAEVAVSTTEVEAVQERVAALQLSRRRRGGRPIRGDDWPEPQAAAIT